MNGLFVKAKTAIALGWLSIARVLAYRVGVKLGLNPVRRLAADPVVGLFYSEEVSKASVSSARIAGYEWLEAFGCKLNLGLSQPPNWFAHVATGGVVSNPNIDWWQIPDFDEAVGDIKGIWELSRFDWLLAAAQHAAHGEADAFNRLNVWLQDWCTKNPPYKGPNWKCGQEASIRVMHLLASTIILQQSRDSRAALLDLLECHLKRIEPTIQYAVGQDNNHGTSEAAALFTGGAWLAAYGRCDGERWCRMGRKWLENRVHKLVQTDGTFSQYSLTYHRLMLDTLSFVEVVRRHFELPIFSARYNQKASLATRWLFNMTDPETGDGPNVGANDGAHILKLTDSDYRDLRPSVQLAAATFLNKAAYTYSPMLNDQLAWLGVKVPSDDLSEAGSQNGEAGGFMLMRCNGVMAMLRYPRFRFRPSQADCLHLDLWRGEKNLLRDAGTYSYNTSDELMNYFGGTKGHNTVQFDGRDQMPRLSRFLFGAWLRTEKLYPINHASGCVTGGASYRDWQGARHSRQVSLSDERMLVTDDVEGFQSKAVLRWRLIPGDWILSNQSQDQKEFEIHNGEDLSMTLTSTVPVSRCELTEGWESRYYSHKSSVPVVELEIHAKATLTTQVVWPL